MAVPSEKNPEIDQLVTKLTGIDRQAVIKSDRCVPPPIGCGGPAVEFRDDLSRKEYSISGLCQKCQDSIFGDDDPSISYLRAGCQCQQREERRE